MNARILFNELELSVVRVLAEVSPWGVPKDRIRRGMSLCGDLGIDSIGKLNLVLRLEEEVGVDFSTFQGCFEEVKSVGDLLEVVKHVGHH